MRPGYIPAPAPDVPDALGPGPRTRAWQADVFDPGEIRHLCALPLPPEKARTLRAILRLDDA